jgi:CTD small phosphatase-like protein 2
MHSRSSGNGTASPYAAPHSPIASSKRARVSRDKRDSLASPSGAKKEPAVRPLDLKATNGGTGAASEKVIFSPPGAGGGKSSPRDPPSSSSSAAAAHAAAIQAAEEQAAAAEEEEGEIEEFDPYVFIQGLPRHSSVLIRGKKCLPPRPRGMPKELKTLTLDLDETLVHCSIEPVPNPDIIFQVSFQGVSYEVYVRKRPHLELFLQTVATMFEVVVFTASQKVYADKLLDLIDPKKNMIQHRLFREACLCVQGNFIKDLSVLDRDLTKTVLVDNSPHAYGYNVDNGVPILSWFDDPNDTELLKLIEFLKRVQPAADVRDVVRDQFKTHRLVQHAGRVPYRGIPPPLM